jgi:hypothetical protein
VAYGRTIRGCGARQGVIRPREPRGGPRRTRVSSHGLDDVVDHTAIDPSSLELANDIVPSDVIIWTPSWAGLFTAQLITGPCVWDCANAKIPSEPSHRPTAKCSSSSHEASCAIVYVVPNGVRGSTAVDGAASASDDLWSWSLDCKAGGRRTVTAGSTEISDRSFKHDLNSGVTDQCCHNGWP